MSEEKILLVTGGSRGIGGATARAAGREGYRVIVNYVSDERAAQCVITDIEKAGGKAEAIKADVAQEKDIHRLFETIEKKFGRLTHLVNNAGIIGRASSLADADPAKMRAVIDLNVTGAILVAREAIRQMSTARGGRGARSSTFLRWRRHWERRANTPGMPLPRARSTVSRLVFPAKSRRKAFALTRCHPV